MSELAAIQKENASKQNTISELENLLDEHREQIIALQANTADPEEIDSLKLMLTGKETLLSKLTQQMKDQQETLDGLERNLEFTQNDLAEAQQKLNDTSAQDEMKKELEDKSSKIITLQQHTVEKDTLINELESSLQEKQHQMRELELKAGDTSELDLLSKRLEERDSHILFLDNSAVTTNTRLSDLEKHIKLRDAEIINLQAQVKDTTKLDSLLRDLQDKEQRLSVVSTNATESNSKLVMLETSLEDLKASIRRKDTELNSLREEINELNQSKLLATFGEGNVEQHPEMGIIYTAVPKVADNLQEIFGISDVLSEQLNELGVYRFKQLALWAESQVNHFQEKLAFEGSISREQWVKQAQRLSD